MLADHWRVAALFGVALVSSSETSPATAGNRYAVFSNVAYLPSHNESNRLDIYKRRDLKGPQPTVVFIHGGGWSLGTKEGALPNMMPWFEAGWNVVNVEYRLAPASLAPAALEDCLCALRWIASHASEYGIDTTRLVLTGESAGGHLALAAGMIPESAGLDRECSPGGVPMPQVAAIVNWYGPTDVADLIGGGNARLYAVTWFGSLANREEVARRVSPLTYVRPGLPPVLTIHSDADPVVPYSHAVRLRDALENAGVPNQLVTVHGDGHGFLPEEQRRIFAMVWKFLELHGLRATGLGCGSSQMSAWRICEAN
jgi:acetyl esterase/lipase